MSFVAHRRCNSKDAVQRFYFRWGAQAAIAQLLGCADLHRQNWIASGEQPVLVDADMLGDAFLKRPRTDRVNRLHPLLRTGLLPIVETDGVGRYEAIAPFDSRSLSAELNVFWPVYTRRRQLPEKYLDQIVDGFVKASRFVCDGRNRKAFECFIAQATKRRSLRVLKRATVKYRQIFDESLHARYLQKRGARLAYLIERCGEDRTGLIEAHCLVRCSIPRFTSNIRNRKSCVPALRVMLDSTMFLRSRL